ncbi:MAG TPA: hypothetical protein VIV57_15275 [Anaeromyxobacter sp.]
MRKLMPISCCLGALFVNTSSAWGAPKAQEGDVLRPAPAAAAAKVSPAGVTVNDVGDVDSFGRNVTYIGVSQTSQVLFQPDCTPDPANPLAPNDRCIVLSPAPSTTGFDETELSVIKLPAKATHSIVCHSLTPLVTFQLNNTTGAFAPSAAFNATVTVRIENEVLNDPTLIDPATGLPFGGSFEVALPTWRENRSLAVDERAQKQMILTRECIGGLISRSALIQGEGLSEAQADAFFKKPITLHFGVRGSARLVDFALFTAGIRLYGD